MKLTQSPTCLVLQQLNFELLSGLMKIICFFLKNYLLVNNSKKCDLESLYPASSITLTDEMNYYILSNVS